MDPDKEEAKRALLSARNQAIFEYDSSSFDALLSHITTAFNEAKKRKPKQRNAEITCSTNGEPIVRRCGRQYSRAYEGDRYCLVKDYFSCDMQKNVSITSLFVRRSVYHAFWGDHSATDMESVPLNIEPVMADASPVETRSGGPDSNEEMRDVEPFAESRTWSLSFRKERRRKI